MLRVEHLSKRWPDGTHGLIDVNFEVQPGTLTAIIGPSGGGKSTILRLLAGLETPDEGRVVNSAGQPGMVFQEPSLWPHLTLLENVSLALRVIKGESASQADQRASAILAAWHLSHRLNAHPAELSGGEQQRGALARATVVKPAVLCLDEITSSLDPETSAEILRSVLEWKRADTTIVLATHQIGFARASADQVILLDKGRIVEAAPGSTVITSPTHPRTRAFIEAATMR